MLRTRPFPNEMSRLQVFLALMTVVSEWKKVRRAFLPGTTMQNRKESRFVLPNSLDILFPVQNVSLFIGTMAVSSSREPLLRAIMRMHLAKMPGVMGLAALVRNMIRSKAHLLLLST